MVATIPFQGAKFTLDISGVAGFFGGDEVISAMGSVHFYQGRKYLGWYNSPGSYTVARKYGRLANSRFWNGLFSGGNTDPNVFLGLDGETGPEFLAAHSGTKMAHTGHVAHLLLRECQTLQDPPGRKENQLVSQEGTTTTISNEVAKLITLDAVAEAVINSVTTEISEAVPEGIKEAALKVAGKGVTGAATAVSTAVKKAVTEALIDAATGLVTTTTTDTVIKAVRKGVGVVAPGASDKKTATDAVTGTVGGGTNSKPTHSVYVIPLPPDHCLDPNLNLSRPWKIWMALFPLIASAGPAAVCAYFRDWYCFSMIALGMLSSGIACLTGDGVLHSGTDFVAVIGKEESVCSITRGAFSIELRGAPRNHIIGLSAILLIVQFFLQLLLIPQGTLFGQVMFLVTFACSWVYNCYLSSIDKEEVQRTLLMEQVLGIRRSRPGIRRSESRVRLSESSEPNIQKYVFAKRTTAVVFLLLVLRPLDKEMILNQLLPNDTLVWRKWKREILEQLRTIELESEHPAAHPPTEDDNLLNSLRIYACIAREMYKVYQENVQSPAAPAPFMNAMNNTYPPV
ncbi:hypothetical protein FRC17_010836 [Serendipita sp. 399]|nr:hypothetical protein FRC17_010836 [Serendipita sp. 399]